MDKSTNHGEGTTVALHDAQQFSIGGITRPKFSTRLVKPLVGPVKRKTVYPNASSNHWSSTEYTSTNAWNVNFGDGNINNNNKYNTNVVRPACAALEISEIISWLQAFEDCCHHKKSTIQCSIYRIGYEQDLLNLAREVKSRTYKPSVSTCFVVTRPKYREIFAANFRDRIVQHWITLRINNLLEKKFIESGNVSFNCRVGFGTLAAVNQLRSHIEKISAAYTSEAWIGKFDMKNFFMSIDKGILLSKIIPFIRSNYKGDDIETLLWLLEVTINHEPQESCIKRGKLHLWDELPEGKSLFDNPPGIGMPIGNITSQLLANFYLSWFDDFMVNICLSLGCEYIRFVDDFVIVSPDKRNIKPLWETARCYLKNHLHIELHPDKIYIQEAKKGVKFVGSVIKPGRVYTSNRTVGGFVSTLHTLDKLCWRLWNESARGLDCTFLYRDLVHYVCSANSYMGFLVHANSYALRTKYINNLAAFWAVCETDMKTKKVKIRDEFNPLNQYLHGKDRKHQTKSRHIRDKNKKGLSH